MSAPNGSQNGHRYNVGGILLERPFKIRRLGHFGFNITKLEEARRFYGDLLGFIVSDKADFSRAPWFPKDAGLGDTHARQGGAWPIPTFSEFKAIAYRHLA